MITMDIPGWGNMDIEDILLNLNGTLATDGKIPSEVKEKMSSLSHKAKIYIVAADPQGTASEESSDMDVELLKVSEEDSTEVKFRVLEPLDPTKTVVIGNGNNDHLILNEAALGIAVLGDEGKSVSAIQNADLETSPLKKRRSGKRGSHSPSILPRNILKFVYSLSTEVVQRL